MWKLLNGVIRLFSAEEVEANDQQDERHIIEEVSRRGFLKGLGAIAIAQAIPFNRVWSFPSIIRVPGYSGAESLALQLERVRDQIPLLYERDYAMIDVMNRRTWAAVPWDHDMQMFGSSSGEFATQSIEGYSNGLARKAMFQFEDEVRSAVAEAHRVLQLPE